MFFLKKSRRFFQKKSNDFSIVFACCKNINVSVIGILYLYFYLTMFESGLLGIKETCGRVINIDGICAIFVENGKNSYDVSLDVNSQKFLISYSDEGGVINSFEVVSFKGFAVNLTNSLILALRGLVDFLRSEL